MSSQLLTLIIPTYNRAEHLSLLLKALSLELYGLENKVKVILGDNASTDQTPLVINSFLETYPTVKVLRYPENLGAEENFCKCIDEVDTPFFWIIGDDDIPKKNVIAKILNFLQQEKPDLLYLNSEWLPIVTSQNDGGVIESLKIKKVSRDEFAKKVNVWITFVSGMIVNLESLLLLKLDIDIRKYENTSLVQLGWVLPLLMRRSNFYMISEQCVLATSGNTGGYKLLTVFGLNFPTILEQECRANLKVQSIIIKSLTCDYLPPLIWTNRKNNLNKFLYEDPLLALRKFKGTGPYLLIFWPLIKLPMFIALSVWVFYRLFNKLRSFTK